MFKKPPNIRRNRQLIISVLMDVLKLLKAKLKQVGEHNSSVL